MLILIHKRKSALPSGSVTDASGRALGRVFTSNRVAAGTNGEWRRFWTAEVCWPGDAKLRNVPSLGTRYVTRAQAAAAVRSFHALYTLDASERSYATLGAAVIGWQRLHRDAAGAAHAMNRYPEAV